MVDYVSRLVSSVSEIVDSLFQVSGVVFFSLNPIIFVKRNCFNWLVS